MEEDVTPTAEPEIPVVALNFYDPKPQIESIKTLGCILDKEKEAEEFIVFSQGIVNDIKERVSGIPEGDKPRVFFEIMKPYKTVNEQYYNIHEQIVIAGGINIAADLPGGPFIDVDPEWVMMQNPDAIVRMAMTEEAYGNVPIACGYDVDDPTGMQVGRDEIMNRPELAQIDAVRNGRVYLYHYELSTTIRHFIGLVYFAKWFHPELFQDIDPQAIHQEYLTRFLGIDYDLTSHGVFMCPPAQ